MENLFTATLSEGGHPVAYEVHFENDRYIFKPKDGTGPGFELRREHEAWVAGEGTGSALAGAAAEALDRYLLRQH